MRELGAGVDERNYAKEPLTRAEIGEIIAAAGVERALNTRHEVAKSRGWKDRLPSAGELLEAALEDNNLLRRPVLLSGKKAAVGFDEAAIREVLARS